MRVRVGVRVRFRFRFRVRVRAHTGCKAGFGVRCCRRGSAGAVVVPVTAAPGGGAFEPGSE